MHNIPEQIEGFHMSAGEYPTHLLLNKEHYSRLLKECNASVPMKHLYGLEVIFTEVPIEPRILRINE